MKPSRNAPRSLKAVSKAKPRARRTRAAATFYHYDCRHFRGEKPCGVAEACKGCASYEPVTSRVLIIKLAARGDVLRTTPLLRALKHDGAGVHVTWVVDPASHELLRENPLIDRLLVFRWEDLLPLTVERFDLVLSLDKEPRATALAMRVRAKAKRGFGLGADGALRALSPESVYAYDLGIHDRMKFFENTKTYQEIIFEMAGLRYRRERYVYEAVEEERRAAARALQEAGLAPGERALGLNTGGGRAFANKGWTVGGFARLAERIESELGRRVVLLGGDDEREKNAAIARASAARTILPGLLPMRVFAALLGGLDAIVTGDTLGLHLALALNRPVIALFGSTTPREIDIYDLGEKVLPAVDCAPCYLRVCPVTVTCMDSISVADVMAALRRVAGDAALSRSSG
ncbi:MAG: glycosyltransferase family 9 protein [bacterium]